MESFCPRCTEECSRCGITTIQSVWGGKPGAVVSVSTGLIGGFDANDNLRQSLVFLDIPTMKQPEAHIGGAVQLFDAEGKITHEGTCGFLAKFMETVGSWVDNNLPEKSLIGSSGMGFPR